jgi:sulfatase modifying factor 1
VRRLITILLRVCVPRRVDLRLWIVMVAIAAVGGGVYFLQQKASVPEGFVRIQAGSFDMGSPSNEKGRHKNEAVHRVKLTRPFFLQTTEVTQRAYQALMGKNPSRFSKCKDCPVENVSWFDAIRYVNALSKKQRLPACYDSEGKVIGGDTVYDCKGYRLPTEAEWAFAARAGSTGKRYGELDAIAWYVGNSKGKTHPTGTKQPNTFGLYDMLGSVFEWCHDWYSESLGGSPTDPEGPVAGSGRVFRGGSWTNSAKSVRAAYRFRFDPSFARDFYGFRLARTVPLIQPTSE